MAARRGILWRRLDRPGHEAGWLSFEQATWRLMGTAVFAHIHQPCRLDYLVICDEAWQTMEATVMGWVGESEVKLRLAVDPTHRWWVNGVERLEVAGCRDLDLAFSPATNLLPIRRLSLAVGQQAPVVAAWLRFPDFTLGLLEQVYHRIGAGTYRYESAGGAFVRELTVNEAGFVTDYPGFWTAEAAY